MHNYTFLQLSVHETCFNYKLGAKFALYIRTSPSSNPPQIQSSKQCRIRPLRPRKHIFRYITSSNCELFWFHFSPPPLCNAIFQNCREKVCFGRFSLDQWQNIGRYSNVQTKPLKSITTIPILNLCIFVNTKYQPPPLPSLAQLGREIYTPQIRKILKNQPKNYLLML